ncbi:GntR family transcriptional regulator [Acidobacteriota bacterium]
MSKGTSQNKSFPKTLSDRIYLYLKESIMMGKIKPNQRVMEKDIAAEFGISTTPVREAIKRLSGEGLIHIDSHKEAVVREVSYTELMHIYEAMVCLDEKCIKLAFDRDRQATLKELGSCLKEMQIYIGKNEVEKYLECNERMHLRLSELSGNEFLLQIRQLINAQLGRYRPLRMFLFSRSNTIERYMETNKMFLQAIQAEDWERIEQIDPEDWIRHLPSEEEWLEFQENLLDTVSPIRAQTD